MKTPVDGRRAPPPNYHSRSVQLRLLCLVFALMTVLLLMFEAAKPSTWQALWGGDGGQPQWPAGTMSGEEDIDNRLYRDPRPPAPTDVVIIGAARTPPTANDPLLPVGVAHSEYAVIQDDTVFRADEHRVWFATLSALANPTIANINGAEAPTVSFTQLFRQPDHYRGRLVTVKGTVRRAHLLTAPTNNYGIDTYWQCWLFPDGTTNPIVVYSASMPVDFPAGMRINETVAFQGIFFKRWAYAATDGERTAPLILASDGNWTRRPPPGQPWQPRWPAVTAAILISISLAATVAWLAYRQSIAFAARHRTSQVAANDGPLTIDGRAWRPWSPPTLVTPSPTDAGEGQGLPEVDARKDST